MDEDKPPADNWSLDTMRVKTIWLDEQTPLCVIRLFVSEVSDEVWNHAFAHMRRFLRWIKKTGHRYHFLFDLHEADGIPLDRLYQLQKYLEKKDALIRSHLHSSAIITQSKLLEMVLMQAFELWPPRRPSKVFIQPRVEDAAERDVKTEIPVRVYQLAIEYLLSHRLG